MSTSSKQCPRNARDSGYKVRLFRSLFSGLENAYGTYDPRSGRSWQVKKPVTDRVILAHLTGKRPYGVYLLVGGRTRACVADFDREDLTLPADFVAAAKHYGLSAYIERSKSKGYHLWIFFEETGVSAAKARLVFRHILDEIEQPSTEVFPKQNPIRPGSSKFGNFINAPLFGRLAPKERTVFIDPDNGFRPFPNQWVFLESVAQIDEGQLDEIIEVNELEEIHDAGLAVPISLGAFQMPQALPPCARKMLKEGVTAYQRVSCFRLAVQLRRVGLPFDLVVAVLTVWSKKNCPENGKRIITHREVKAQTAAAFLKEYRGVGCDEPALAAFCSASCSVSANGNDVPGCGPSATVATQRSTGE
jgi:TOTE conflict system primase-like protein